MVVVYLDGVDGAGKTTLLKQLAEHIPKTVIAPPLWRYLSSISAPDQFAAWVTSTAPDCVATDLLDAQTDRIAGIQDTAPDPRHHIVLVDRGPKTVLASARAHLAARLTHHHGLDLDRSVAALDQQVQQLARAQPSVSIELTVADYADIASRLSNAEQGDLVYRHYLTRFLGAFRAAPDVMNVRSVVLPALETVDRNVAEAKHAISVAQVDH